MLGGRDSLTLLQAEFFVSMSGHPHKPYNNQDRLLELSEVINLYAPGPQGPPGLILF